MSATKTQAFVLKTQDYRDTSLLATFYTADHGKVRGILKGVRDDRARFGSTLEPFSLNEILFYKRRRGGDLHQVTQAELLDLFGEVRGDLERLSYAVYMIELLDQLVEVEDPSPPLFKLLHESRLFLAGGASPRRVARVFEVKFLEILGLMPEVKSCVACRAEIADTAYFHPAFGGILCKACRASRGRTAPTTAAGMPVSRGTLNFLDHVRRSPVKDLERVKVSHEVGEEVEKALRRFVDFHLPSKLKSVVFLEKMGIR